MKLLSAFLSVTKKEVQSIFAVQIGALNAGNPLGIVSAADELLHHLRDTLDAEAAVDDGVFVLVLISETLEVFFEQELDGVDSPRQVDRLLDRSDLKG
jgi:hypothetical protein